MSSFQDLGVSVHNNTEAEGVTRSRCRTGSLSVSCISTQHARNSFVRLGVILNENPLNLEKSTYSVQSVILINLWRNLLL